MADGDYGIVVIDGEEYGLTKHTAHFGHKAHGHLGEDEDDHEMPYKKMKIALTATMGINDLTGGKVIELTLKPGGGLTFAEWDEGDLLEEVMLAIRNHQDLIGAVEMVSRSDFPYPLIVAIPSLPIRPGRRQYGKNYVSVMVNKVPGKQSCESGTKRSLKHAGARFLIENPGITHDNLTANDLVAGKKIVLVNERSPIVVANNSYYDERSEMDVLDEDEDPLMLNGKAVELFEAGTAVNGSFQMPKEHYEYFEAAIRRTMTDNIPLGNATGPEFKVEVFTPSGTDLTAVAIDPNERFTLNVMLEIEYLRVGKDVEWDDLEDE